MWSTARDVGRRRTARVALFAVGGVLVLMWSSSGSSPAGSWQAQAAEHSGRPAAAGPELVLQIGHSEEPRCVAVSPDGRFFATGAWDATVKLWEAETGDLIRTLRGHTGYVHSVAFSPDGTMLASGSADGTTRLWDPTSGSPVRTLGEASGAPAISRHIVRDNGSVVLTPGGANGAVSSVAFSPQGTLLATGVGTRTDAHGQLRVWDYQAATVRWAHKARQRGVSAVAFSPDGTAVASGTGDGLVQVCDALTGEPRWETAGHRSNVHSLSFSPDSGQLASGGGDGWVAFWDVRTGESLGAMQTGGGNSVAFSRDWTMLASARGHPGWGTGDISLWDASSGDLVRTLPGHSTSTSAIALSPDGEVLVSTGRDGEDENLSEEVKLWEVATAKLIRRTPGRTSPVGSVAFAPSGSLLSYAMVDGSVRVWDLDAGEMVTTLSDAETPRGLRALGWAGATSFSPDGGLIAWGGIKIGEGEEFQAHVKLFDPNTGEQRRVLHGAPYRVPAGLQFSSDGKTLVALGLYPGESAGTIMMWDMLTGKQLWDANAPAYAAAIAMSPDGETVACASSNIRAVVFHNAHTGAVVRTLKLVHGGVGAVAFSPDGHMIATGHRGAHAPAGGSGTVALWDLGTDTLLHQLPVSTGGVTSIAFAPDGAMLAAGSGVFRQPGEIRIWETATGDPVCAIAGLAAGVRSIAFSPSGKLLASGGSDNAVRLWDTGSGSLLGTLIAFRSYGTGEVSREWICFSPEGAYNASADADQYMRWRVDGKLFPARVHKDRLRRPGFLGKAIAVSESRPGGRKPDGDRPPGA